MINTLSDLKATYINYYEDVPVQKYAAMAIGKNEDTIIRWRQQDQAFADAVEKAKAGWVRKRVLATKAEFALERLEKSVFAAQATELKVEASLELACDPNTPDNKVLVDQMLTVLMKETSRG